VSPHGSRDAFLLHGKHDMLVRSPTEHDVRVILKRRLTTLTEVSRNRLLRADEVVE
jgi:hypothetical protein